ncbi:MAG: chemotaxis protein CheW [Cyclobacteriaceae bacterium]|jgi:purine-binding chemotaxis protein CheW|nr:chemotaxis protein CheW [Cytophagales bacterium]MCZ8326770.1 chemotaxis protein CheW [Cyclobacteriaceae bacterium]
METQSNQAYLTFTLGKETFGAHVGSVLEIVEVPAITTVPQAASYMRGVINLRGSVLPVVDTRIKMGLPTQDDSINTCIVVIQVEQNNQLTPLGIVVDAIQEVIDIQENTILPAPSLGNFANTLLTGMVKHQDKFVLLVNIQKLFSTEEIFELTETEQLH